MDYKSLSNDLADVFVDAIQLFDYIDKNGAPMVFKEATESFSGGIERYRSDPIFRAKVQMLVSRVTAVVREHDVSSAGIER